MNAMIKIITVQMLPTELELHALINRRVAQMLPTALKRITKAGEKKAEGGRRGRILRMRIMGRQAVFPQVVRLLRLCGWIELELYHGRQSTETDV